MGDDMDSAAKLSFVWFVSLWILKKKISLNKLPQNMIRFSHDTGKPIFHENMAFLINVQQLNVTEYRSKTTNIDQSALQRDYMKEMQKHRNRSK